MIVAVVSCWKYRDAWKPFFELFRKFWPDCEYPIYLVSDKINAPIEGVTPVVLNGNWCQIVSAFAEQNPTEMLVLLEDFFFTAPVRSDVIREALDIMTTRKDSIACRLFPVPGADKDVDWSNSFGLVSLDAPYRVCCQAAIWNPHYLKAIAGQFIDPWEFEINGTASAKEYRQDVFAWKRDIRPWPMDYICSAISRGKWNPDAKKLCDQHGIAADFSMRPMDE